MMNKSILLLTLLACFVGCRREDYRAMTVALPGLDDFEAIAGANAAAMAREQVTAEFSIYSKIGDDDQAMSGIDTSTFAWDGSTLSLAFNSLETAEMNVIRLLDEVRLATNVEATVEIVGLPARWAVGNDRERAAYAAAREQIVGSIAKMAGVDSCAWNDTPPVADQNQSSVVSVRCASQLPLRRDLRKTVDVKVGPETLKFKLNVLERTVKVHGDEFALRPAYPELKEGTPAGYINARKDEVPAPAKKN